MSGRKKNLHHRERRCRAGQRVYLIRDGGLCRRASLHFREVAELRWCSRRIRRRPIRLHHARRAHVGGTLHFHF